MGDRPARRSTSARPRLRSTAGGGSSRPSCAAQHVLADQRRRRRQAGRKLHAAVVERLACGRMAEGDRRHARARPRRELAAMGAHQPVEAPARQALQAADQEEGLSGERQSRLRPQRAALRACGLAGRGLARRFGHLGRLLARRARPAVGARLQAALQRLHDVDDVAGLGRLGHGEALAGLLGLQHGGDGFLVAVGEACRARSARTCGR